MEIVFSSMGIVYSSMGIVFSSIWIVFSSIWIVFSSIGIVFTVQQYWDSVFISTYRRKYCTLSLAMVQIQNRLSTLLGIVAFLQYIALQVANEEKKHPKLIIKESVSKFCNLSHCSQNTQWLTMEKVLLFKTVCLFNLWIDLSFQRWGKLIIYKKANTDISCLEIVHLEFPPLFFERNGNFTQKPYWH